MDTGTQAAMSNVKCQMSNAPDTESSRPDKIERVSLPITGMSCAACAARIEKTLNRTEGVRRASVNFEAHRATVEYAPKQTDTRSLIGVIQEAGYRVEEAPPAGSVGAPEGEADWEQQAREQEYRDLGRRLLVAGVLGLPVTVVAMLHLDFPGNHWLQLLLTTPIML